jgi:hypothetical protein
VATLALLDPDGVAHEVRADALAVDGGDLEAATGWALKPEGLCRGDVCVPLLGRQVDAGGGRVDLEAWADALRLPLAVDLDEGVAAVVTASGVAGLAGTPAPDLELPDLQGQPVNFARFAGRKRVLLAWASW